MSKINIKLSQAEKSDQSIEKFIEGQNLTKRGNLKSKISPTHITTKMGLSNAKWKNEYGLELIPTFTGPKGGMRYSHSTVVRTKDALTRKAVTPWNVAIVGKNYSLLPNERAFEMTEDVISKYFKNTFAKATASLTSNASGNVNNGGYLSKEGEASYRYSKDGGQIFAYWVSNDKINVNGEDYPCSVGLMMKNSIDGTCGFSINAFTFRWACSNGMIMGKRDLLQFSQRHVGDIEALESNIVNGIRDSLAVGTDIIEQYRGWTKAKFSQAMANQFVSAGKVPTYYGKNNKVVLGHTVNVPQSAFKELDYIEPIQRKVQDARGDIKYLYGAKVNEEKAPSAWDAHNQINEAIWWSKKIDEPSKQTYTEKLQHAIMVGVTN